jgi:hypothetical protein
MKLKTTLLFTICCLILKTNLGFSQCTVTTISGDFNVSSSIILSGTYSVTGKFTVPAGVTVFVNKYSSNSCGKLEIYAKSAVINGVINADDAGYTGGLGGVGGTSVTSITGDQVSLTGCNNKDNTGHVSVEGGKQGFAGSGPGAGLSGGLGQNGSGPKQQCLNSSDEAGMIGSGGGGGGGAGGSYGGKGGNAGAGGNGTNSYTTTGVNVSTGYAVVNGIGGTGGVSASVYGSPGGNDIDLGSGGAGSGGGARSLLQGGNGNKGGNGGGMVKIVVQDTLIISGTITANGSNGLNGGTGGDGGVTAKCCSDGCDDCGEATLSCGAGGGGGSGAGSGGGIYLESGNKVNITGNLSSKGGNGGAGGIKGNGTSCNYSATFCGTQGITSGGGSAGNLGGGAGGGRIKIFAPSCVSNTITPTTIVSGGTGFASGISGTYSVICNVSSLLENTVYHKLSIYPNPSSNYINVNFLHPQLLKDNQAEFQIYSVNGKLVSKTKCELNQMDNQTINVSDLSNGVYFLKLVANDATVVEKFIKH